MSAVYNKSFPAPELDRKEILRYAGVHSEADAELKGLLEGVICEAKSKLRYRVCYTELPIWRTGETINFGFAKISSSALEKELSGCDRALVFAATVGIEIDRLIKRSMVSSPSRALIFDALGTERIEALCDAFCDEYSRELSGRGMALSRRFSPGYADLPLSFQKDIFSVLQCDKIIGLTLNESLIMSPSKSVSAIVGIRNL